MVPFKTGQRVWARMVLSAVIISLSGCAGFGSRLESPRINVANIQVQEIKAFEAIFQIELRVINTNDIPLDVKGVNCDLELNGKRFASGVSNADKIIPPYGTDIVPITVYSSVLGMARGVLSMHGQEKVKYGLNGRLRLGGNSIMMPSSIPFKSSGELKLQPEKP